ncbi:MAG: anaerobic ribonucleoside-triphosphate reductase, partial [Candidatus Hydrogenedentes bacterium]|nr:anaerobic ribonucleoside-triphosphate reductase [Candidatus Hydrogenedentota bacterium]
EEFRRRHMRIGVPLYDAERIICMPGETERITRQDPESTDRLLAQRVKREYALTQVFSENVVDAHVFGDIHLGGLGYIDRLHEFSANLEVLARYGAGLPGARATYAPPQDLETFLVQLGRFRTQVDAHFAGPVTWELPHVHLSPFLDGADEETTRRAAHILLFVLGTDASERAAKPEITLSWGVPSGIARRRAAGPPAHVGGNTYGDYEMTAKRFLDHVLAVYLQSQARSLPLLRFVVTPTFFSQEGYQDVLVRVAETAIAHGLLEIAFDRSRDGAPGYTAPYRGTVAQVVNLNLPRMAFRSPDEGALMENLATMVDLAAQAHQEKSAFLERLAALRALGPHVFLDETPARPALADLSKAAYVIAVDGLNECVETLCGNGLAESDPARVLALRILARLVELCHTAQERIGLRIIPAQARYESSIRRFAALDLRPFPEKARRVAKSDPITQDIHYTVGARLARMASWTPSERATLEGAMHELIPHGALTRISLPDMETSPEALAAFIETAYYRSQVVHMLLERPGVSSGLLPHE